MHDAQESSGTEPAIILFDGVCNLCNRAVDFIIRRDIHRRFRFASLQSGVGERLLAEHEIDPDVTDSIVLVEQGEAFVRSTAALRILRRLGGGWRLLYGLIALPRTIRDWVYRRVANNRYAWFGKRDSCRVPTPDERSRFLE